MSESNLVYLDIETTLPIPPERVLDGAKDEGIEEIIVIGIRADKSLYLAMSHSYVPDLLFLLERAKREIYED